MGQGTLRASKASKADAGHTLTVWKKPETEMLRALYTITLDGALVCKDATIETAMQYLRARLE